MFATLRYNSIQHVCGLKYNNSVLSLLDMSNNALTKLTSYCFSYFESLRKLSMKNNIISTVDQKTFSNLLKIFSIDLSKNRLTVIPKGTFSNLTTLFIFILYDNPPSQIDCEMFSGFHVRIIHSNNFQICCIAQSVHLICTHSKHWYNSCDNLLPNDSLKIFLVLVSTLVLVVNFQFIILQLRRAKSSYFCIVVTLSLTYVSLSLYLIAVWFVHLHYGKCFVTEKFHWRDSVVCASISTGILCYNLLQPFLLVLLSLAR